MESDMDLIITILGWFTLGFISTIIVLIICVTLYKAITRDYKLYKHIRFCEKLLRERRYEDYAWLLAQMEIDTEVYRLTHPETATWTFDDWKVFYLNKANVESYHKQKYDEKKY